MPVRERLGGRSGRSAGEDAMNCPRCKGTRLTAVPTGALMDASEYQVDCLDCGAMWRAIRGGGRIRPTPKQEDARIKEWANVTFVEREER